MKESVTVDAVSHCGTARTSDLPSPVSGENANTELLVPRSMPMLNMACAITIHTKKPGAGGHASAVLKLFRSDLEFDLPPAIRFRMLHPKLKIA